MIWKAMSILPGWSAALSVAWVVTAQGVCGVVAVGVAGVGVGICCEGFETEFAGGGEDAGCDFASGS